MHKIGDNVMYGANGVMTIVDIREESIGDISRSYYVLRPTLVKTDSLTFVPTENETLVAAMRPLLTKDELIALLRNTKDAPPIEWISDNRARQDKFKKIMESCDRVGMIRMIRAINESAARRESEGKKNFLADENLKQKAEKQLFSEFSIVLGIPEEDVPAFIKEHTN